MVKKMRQDRQNNRPFHIGIMNCEEPKPTPFCGSSRAALMLIMMSGLALYYAMRVDMSFAILCMVNHTAVGDAVMKDVGLDFTNATNNQSNEVVYHLCNHEMSTKNMSASEDGPFLWSSSIQNQILGAFFFGYFILQAPGGYLANAIGGRWIIFFSMVALAISTVLLPLIASSWVAVACFRALHGLVSGAVIPAILSMISQWAPPMERTIMTTIAFSGTQLGNVFTFPITGILCRYAGWQTVFYFWGGLTFAWVGLWLLFGYNRPSNHPRIQPQERQYILHAIGNTVGSTSMNVCAIPWRKIACSPPIWGNLIANFASDWGAYTFLTQTPRYLKSVHQFDFASNATMSALPYAGYWMVITISGPLADFLRRRNILSTLVTRRVFAIFGFILPSGLLLILGYLSCQYWVYALTVLILIISLSGLQYASWCISLLDIAPKYAGFLWGITNTVSCISGVGTNALAALIMSATPTLAEWRLLFFITAAIMATGCVIYCICVRDQQEAWAIDPPLSRPSSRGSNMSQESVALRRAGLPQQVFEIIPLRPVRRATLGPSAQLMTEI